MARPIAAPAAQRTSLTLGLTVLDTLLDRGGSLGVTQLAGLLGLSKSSVHDILRNLRSLGFVEQSSLTRRYGISPEIFRFIHRFSTRFGPNSRIENLIREAACRKNRTFYVSMLCRRHMFVVCATGPMGDTHALGVEAPVYASSCGKALVAQMPRAQWANYAPRRDDPRLTPNTITDRQRFLREIERARKTGVGWNARESAAGICSVAAPIPTVETPSSMAVALVLSAEGWEDADHDELARAVKELASQLGSALHPAVRRVRHTEPN